MNALNHLSYPARAATLAAMTALVACLQGCGPVIMAGVGATAFTLDDRRSVGAQTEDKEIDLRTENRITVRFGDKVHINVTSYNRNVLLTGEVPDAAAKTEIEKIAREVPNVRGIVNEIQVAGASSLGARGNDTFLTSKVKARFVDNGGSFNANHVKVVTEGGVVYLFGLVTKKEADAAVEIARTTGGVQKVVRMFETIATPLAPVSTAVPAPAK